LQGFLEFAPGVGPAGGERDARMLRSVGLVGGVAIALEDAAKVSEQVIEAGAATAGVPLVKDIAAGRCGVQR